MRALLFLAGLMGTFLGWNMPNHYPLWTTFHGELAAGLGVCCLFAAAVWPAVGSPATGVSRATNEEPPAYRLGLPASAKVWSLIGLIPLVQFAVGQLTFRGDAALGLLYACGVAASLYTGHLWAAQVGSKRALEVMFLTVVWSAIAAGGLALVQWLRLPALSWWSMELIESRPYGNLAQPNLFGLLMVMGIVSVTALFEMSTLHSRWSHGLAVAFFGWCLLVSESRACMFALLAIMACWFMTHRQTPSRLRLADVLTALILGLAAYRFLAPIEEFLYLKATELRPPLDVGPREWIWRHFWAAIQARPWFGYGFEQGVAALREVADQVHPSRNATYAHNVVLDLMTWAGIPLGLLMSAALGVWMLRWIRRQGDTSLAAQRHGVFAIWLALLVHSMLEFPFAHAFFLLPAALMAGAIIPTPDGMAYAARRRIAPSRPAMALASFTGLLLALITWDYVIFEGEFRENRFDKANFIGRVARDAPPALLVLDQLDALNQSAHFDIRAGMPAAELAQLGILARRFHLLPTRFSYAKALALNGRMPEALAEMRMIRSIYHPTTYTRIDQDWHAWLDTIPELRKP